MDRTDYVDVMMDEPGEFDEIEIRGIQKTNTGPLGESDNMQMFQSGIVGGSVSDEFDDAMKFREVFESTAENGE